jgi:NAD(P)-dependent dehydrogenase (short-subunit alcohol dehydrogenase family)
MYIRGDREEAMKQDWFKDKKCFITGAASGIGKAVALALGESGARLFLTDINAKQLEEVAAQISKSGGSVEAWKALDIASYPEVKKFADEVQATSGPMDAIMNIAGFAIWGAPDLLKYEHWKKMIDVNLMGPIHVIECLLPAMVRARNGGRLVNVASAAGLIYLPWHAAYSASKFGLRGLSEILRYDLRRAGIGVTVVCPGAVRTPLVGTAQVVGVDRSGEEAKKFAKRFEGRAVTPEYAARKIIDGAARNRRLVFTSPDIRVAYWLKRKMYPVYHLVMVVMNNMVMRFVKKLKSPAA